MSVVSPKSLYNHLLAKVSVVLSRLGVDYTAPMPTFLSVEPSSVCQLSCPQCPCGQRAVYPMNREKWLSLATFQKILSDCQGWVHTIQFYFQGEPLLNPQLPQMIHLAHLQHIYTTCSTNAQALTPLLAMQLLEAGLDRIIVSIDGLSEESYQAYRVGGTLNQALKGLIYLREAKDKTGASVHIELQCLRLKSNEHEWHMLQQCYHQMGADSLTLKSAQFYDYKEGNPLMPTENRYCRYKRLSDGIYTPKNRLKSVRNQPCARLLSGCVVTTNGDVLPCCFDKEIHHVMGNIHTSSLRQIWQGKTFQTFREHVYLNRMDYAICHNCTE